MKRAKHVLPSRVYSYWCAPMDPESTKLLREQAEARTQAQARFTAIEVERRRAVEAVMLRESAAYAAAVRLEGELTARLDECYDTLSAERARKRKRVSVEEVEAAIKRLKDERASAWGAAKAAAADFRKALVPASTALKAQRQAMLAELGGSPSSAQRGRLHRQAVAAVAAMPGTPAVWAELQAIEARANDAENEARRTSFLPDLCRDTKELAREAFKSAAAKTFGRGVEMRSPRGRDGRVGIAEVGAVVAEDGTITSRDLRLTDQVGVSADLTESKRSQRRRRMLVEMRLAPAGTVTARVLVHRPLPVGAKVVRAWFQLKRVGSRDEVMLQLACQSETLARARAGRVRAVAVKCSWKELPHAAGATPALLVATWEGSDGRCGEVTLDARTNAALLDVETLRKSQDDHHEEAKRVARLFARISGWEWLTEQLEGSGSWRSPRHLAGVAYRGREEALAAVDLEEVWRAWKAAAMASRADLFMPLHVLRSWCRARGIVEQRVVVALYLEWWRRKNLHLRKFEQNARATALARRLDRYRVAAAELAGRYDRMLICQTDKKEAAKKRKPEEKIKGPEQRWTGQRRRAAPSEFEQAACNAFGSKLKDVRGLWKTTTEALDSDESRAHAGAEAAE